ncbi:MAG: hypothetical protein VX669_03610 [Planctomycetota bacterium]|nr:hypothetical protein [Planctomycetota bacterium]
MLTASDPSERTAAFVSPAVQITPGSRARVVGWFQPGRLGGDLGVSIEKDGVVADHRTVAMTTTPRRPFNWRMRIGETEVSSGVDRIEIPVRPGQSVVFINGDAHAAHGLVVPGGSAEGLRETTGSVGELIDPASEVVESSRRPVMARFEVTGELSQPVSFHGLSTGWALSGRFIRGESKPVETVDQASEIEVIVEGAPVVLSQSEKLWMSWGQAAGMDVTGVERDGGRRVELAERAIPWSGPSRRIDHVVDLDAVDAIIMAAGDGYVVDEADSQVLSRWVAAGGHLVVAVGSQRAEWVRSPLAKWVPIRAEKDRQLSDSDLRGLETLALAGNRIPFQGRVGGAILKLRDGRLSVASLSGPLVGVSAYGFGRVTMVAVDIDRRPLARWVDLPRLIERLVEGVGAIEPATIAAESRSTRGQGALSYSGVTDLKTQLHGVQDEFRQVSRPGIWQVFLLVIVVLLLVGPVDFVLVRHLLKRPRATWVTLPLIILTPIGLAVWSGGTVKGREVLVNQLDILDLDAVTGHVEGRSWATIYSGQSQRLKVEVRPADWLKTDTSTQDETDCWVSWSGVPEATFGGMHRAGQRGLDEPDYHVTSGGNESSIVDLPVAVSSTRTLSAMWRHVGRDTRLKAELESRGVGQLSGELTHSLPGAIDDWLVVFGNRVYMPRMAAGRSGTWPSGTPLRLDGDGVRDESLKRYLTRTTVHTVARRQGDGTEVVAVAGQYKPLGRNPLDWVETLTFHRAAGGSGFTGLKNRDLEALDLSELIRLDRAVLVGRLTLSADAGQATDAGTELLIDGEKTRAAGSRQLTYLRIVLPVKSRRIRPTQKFFDPDQESPK